jgi:hypothetical protein
MADMTMVLVTLDSAGNTVEAGDTVTDFRGNTATFVEATRATVTGKSGKVTVERHGEKHYLNDSVFGLTVEGLLRCGCPHRIVWDEGHQAGCLRLTCAHPADQVHEVPGTDSDGNDRDYRQCFVCGAHLDEEDSETVH